MSKNITSYDLPISEQLQDKDYPSEEAMVKMVNEDLLPWFSTHFYYENMSVVPVKKVIELTYSDVIFLREDGEKLAVWESYFRFPEEWKTHRLQTKKIS